MAPESLRGFSTSGHFGVLSWHSLRVENFWSLIGNWVKSFWFWRLHENLAVGAVRCKKRYFGGGRLGRSGKVKHKKLVVGVYSGVGYDFSRGASGKPKEVHMCTLD